MEKSLSGPAGDRAEDFYCNNMSAVPEFKACAKIGQTTLPDSRLLKADLLAAAIQVRKAQTALQESLYIFEDLLEAALDRDEEGGR